MVSPIARQGAALLESLKELPSNVKFSLRDTWRTLKVPVTPAEPGLISNLVHGAGSIMGKSARAGFSIIERPISWAIIPFRGAANFVGNNPIKVAALAVVGTGLYIGKKIRNHAEERTQYDALSQIAEAQQAAAGANLYQATPEQYAELQARQRGGNGPQVGHADAVLASRQPPHRFPAPLFKRFSAKNMMDGAIY